MRVVAGSGDCIGRDGGFDRGDFVGGEPDFESGEAFAELGASACADDRNDGGTLGESPGNGELGLRDALAGGDLSEARDEFLILREVLGGETREAIADVAGAGDCVNRRGVRARGCRKR